MQLIFVDRPGCDGSCGDPRCMNRLMHGYLLVQREDAAMMSLN
jgi:hypothetical protein